MKVGLMADSHDHLTYIRRAITAFAEAGVTTILHAGDIISPFAAKRMRPSSLPSGIELHCCYGNNDGERAGLKEILPQIQAGPIRLELDGVKFVLHHFIDWLKPEDYAGAQVVVTGHTHEALIETRDDVLLVNPGECCGWLHGSSSIALLDTESLSAEIINLGA